MKTMPSIDLIAIALMTTLAIDLTDLIPTIKKQVWKVAMKEYKYRDFSLKPFDCSLCMTWWVCFLYLLITHTLNLYTMAYSLLLAFLTPFIRDLLELTRDICLKAVELIRRLLQL